MEKASGASMKLGSAIYAAKRAADIVVVLQRFEPGSQEMVKELNEVLARYGEYDRVTIGDLRGLSTVGNKLYAIFAAQSTEKAADLLNALFQEYGRRPRLSAHNGTVWHLHVDGGDHAPWAAWFAASSALALAALLAEKQRNPGGICASPTCAKPFIDLGKGGGRRYCSPKCATRERVTIYRGRR